MGIKAVHGDLLAAPQQVIVHQINCLCTRPHGLAESVATRFPYANVYGQRRQVGYKNLAVEADRGTPGDIAVRQPDAAKNESGPIVVGLYGQYDYGKAGRSHRTPAAQDSTQLREQWFVMSLEKLATYMTQNGLTSVAFPHGIGCGLAGGSWMVYKTALVSWAAKNPSFDVVIYQL